MLMDIVRIIELPQILDERGNLSFVQNNTHITFEIKRTYWVYDVPGGESRGGHAYRETAEFVIAISGSFDVIVDDGKEKKTFHLNRSYYGLYIPKGATGKSTHTYIDEETSGTVTDYKGVECRYYERSSLHLEECEYEMSLSREYADRLKGSKEYIK